MSATSLHKLGGSLTQSSILNVREGRVNPQRVQAILSMLTTTSTSYLLLASLDAARKQLALHGREMNEKALHLARWAREALNQIPGIYCFGDERVGEEAIYDYDPTKLTIHVRELGITGYEAEKWLREMHNIEVELSDLYNVLCFITAGDSEETVEALVAAIRDLSRTFYAKRAARELRVVLPKIPELALSPRDAFYAETETVPIDEAVGRIMAESIMVYPPGIPIVMPGEILTEENLAYIRENLAVGLPVQGPEDPTIQTVKVIKTHRAIR